MTNDPSPGTGSATAAADERRWADLADLVLIIAREIQFQGYADERAVQLSPSEGMVMRYLQHAADATPSQIAAATGLQRTNLSTTLRGLEQKGLVERRAHLMDGRGVTVHPTDHGIDNYALVRHEWAATVSAAAGGDSTNLDAALSLLRAVEAGLIKARPGASSRPTP